MYIQMATARQIRKELGNRKALELCAAEFNLIGDLTRLKICYLLCHHKELSVSEIAGEVGASVSAVSHTLRKLEEAKMVEKRRDFRTVYYRVIRSPLVNIAIERIGTHG